MTVRELYNENPFREWSRLAGQSLEFAITTRVLDEYIKSGSTVLDIGGGPGRYSLYYCEKGCDVTLVDIAESNVAFALEEYNLMQRPGQLTAIQSDVLELESRKLPEYDNVIMFGPLYCLTNVQDRNKALQVALKHLKPGGHIFVAYVSLMGPLNYAAKFLIDDVMRYEDELQDITSALLYGESVSNPKESHVRHYSPVSEIEGTFKHFHGVNTVEIFGQESWLSQREKEIEAASPEIFSKWVDQAVKVCNYKDIWKMSEHVVVVGKKSE